MYRKVLIGNPAQLEAESIELKKGELYHVIMDLPFGCNLECLKCYRRGARVSFDDMHVDIRKKVIAKSKERNAQVLVIPGEGEPLMHKKRLFELISYAHSLGMMPLIYTNGHYLDEETIKKLIKYNTTVIFSLDSVNPETYKFLTGGKGDLERVMNNFKMLKKAYKRFVRIEGDTLYTKLGVITIVTQPNKKEISQIKEFIGDEVFHIVNFPIKAGKAEKNWDVLVGDEEGLKELKAIANEHTDAAVGGLTASYKGRCIALHNGVTVDTNGDVLACPAAVNVILGNIQEESLDSLLEKKQKYLEERGNPTCLLRELSKKSVPVLKYHDGVSGKRI
ncbi:MAG: radical SAM protein [Candidatus Nanohaloarchaeota archaeon]|nr:radical SAM protein [Candidatus Nanohaloarchaeota archaeon]